MRTWSSLPLSFVCLGALAAGGVRAQAQQRQPGRQDVQQQVRFGAPTQERVRPLDDESSRAARGDPSISDSVRWAQRSSGGRVLGAERVQSDGRDITRVKVMDDKGRVRYIDDDRQSRRRVDRQRPEPSLPVRDAAAPSRP